MRRHATGVGSGSALTQVISHDDGGYCGASNSQDNMLCTRRDRSVIACDPRSKIGAQVWRRERGPLRLFKRIGVHQPRANRTRAGCSTCSAVPRIVRKNSSVISAAQPVRRTHASSTALPIWQPTSTICSSHPATATRPSTQIASVSGPAAAIGLRSRRASLSAHPAQAGGDARSGSVARPPWSVLRACQRQGALGRVGVLRGHHALSPGAASSSSKRSSNSVEVMPSASGMCSRPW